MIREELISVPGYPTPEGGEVFVITRPGGVQLRAARWRGNAPTRGTVVLFNGRTEFIEKYYEVIQALLERNYAVVTWDWRGQGLSNRLLTDYQKGYVKDFKDYVDDALVLIDILCAEDMPKPLTLLAHSMGGHIGLRLLEEAPELFERAALCAPMTGIATKIPIPVVKLVAGAMRTLTSGTGYAIANGPVTDEMLDFENNPVTRDPAQFDRAVAFVRAKPELLLGGVTWRWTDEALRSIDHVMKPSMVKRLNCPVLVASAGVEFFVDPKSHEKLASMSDKIELVQFPESLHEILQEREEIRARFWNAFDRFTER